MRQVVSSRVFLFGLALGLIVVVFAPLSGGAGATTVAAAPAISSWDESSGYGSLELSRALAAAATDLTSQVSPDVRWAPADVVAAPAESIAVLAARRALETSDPGSPVETALLRIVAGGATWDETSGYGAVEANRAAPVEVSYPSTSDYLPAALTSGQRAESAHLATIPLPGETAIVNPSHDAIANTGCGAG